MRMAWLSLIKDFAVSAHGHLTTVVSTEGQIMLPKAIRDVRCWPAGTRLTVEDVPDGVLLRAVPIFPRADVASVFGSLRCEGQMLSLEDMNGAVASEVKRRMRD